MKELLFESNLGIQFWKEIKGGLCTIRVKTKGKRYTHRIYTIPNIELNVVMPYLSWQNLNCCGGWNYDKNYLRTAVQGNHKLYAGCSEVIGPSETLESKRTELRSLRQSLMDGCIAGEEICLNDSFFSFFICRTGSLKDYFDVEQVIYAYNQLGIKFSEQVQAKIHRYCSVELSQFGLGIPFNYSYAETYDELVVAGL